MIGAPSGIGFVWTVCRAWQGFCRVSEHATAPMGDVPGGRRPVARTIRLNRLSNAMAASSPLYLAATIDLDRAVTWLGETNAQRPSDAGSTFSP